MITVMYLKHDINITNKMQNKNTETRQKKSTINERIKVRKQ